ncbi:Tyrosine-protein kinase [Parasponia andersonii]|uniref:Tyrosine-protein kinase n=1 Tax=Parasponia andersonii TaxID=3476 RepID=A0A2P5D2R3_PARAD|nr:Tyrosine-protein kinase [Parasponia andersonii]
MLFMKNGSKLLEELITCCKDKCRCNPIRGFSAKQVLEATNYFQSYCYSTESYYKWYKGTMDDRPVLIKKYHLNDNNEAYRDIAISSRMSSQKNVLKLLGCCLEFSHPALVYEDAENGPLSSTGGINFNSLSLSWNMRLKVAKEMAYTISYLHIAFARPIIHRNIKPTIIFLGKDYLPKLCDFSFSISIPEGETQVKDLVTAGTFGFVDPSYFTTSIITEHTDVYSFGVFLLVLLTGQCAIDFSRHEIEHNICFYVANLVEKKQFREIVDPKILEEEGGISKEKELQLQAFLSLALACTKEEREERPLMIDVAKQLVKIERAAC